MSTTRQLVCPACGQVMATAVWRTLGGLKLTTPDGFDLAPVSDDLMLRIAQGRLAEASDADRPKAQQQLDLILHDAGDRFYDFRCPEGHITVATAPAITSAVRHASGPSVSLA